MTILDTNVISEALKPRYSAIVRGWMVNQPAQDLFTTSVSKAEILYGIEIMAPGKRRDALHQAARGILYGDLADRILPFDTDSAPFYAERSWLPEGGQGCPIGQSDAQIAASARSRGYSLATRNVADFADCGVEIINPWEG